MLESPRVTMFRKSLVLCMGLLSLLLLTAGSGCVVNKDDATADVFIAGLIPLAAGMGSCAPSSDTSTFLTGTQTLDYSQSGHFVIGVQVRNQLINTTSIDGLGDQPELDIADIHEADVDVAYPAGLTPPDASYTSFKVDTFVQIEPADGSAAVPVELLTPGIVDFLAANKAIGTLQISFRFRGVLHGGGSFATDVVKVNVDVCDGCLASSWAEQCQGKGFQAPCGLQTGVESAFTCNM